MARHAETKRGLATQAGMETIAERVARMRREKGITQVEMAELLGVSQPVVSEYERGTLRLHGELIAKVAEILGVSADEILGLEAKAISKAKGAATNRRLLRRLQQIDNLPKRDQEALLRTIDAFLSKAAA
ncbi:MAG: helix-turn-helix domain-containing protein [Pyrinomonadaceae bacterium MAG19_C2-C3]|nr:helix-turn-helix domain-containing protein [Pyrinomonadaceae bacterium MAG19_C2-C3]